MAKRKTNEEFLLELSAINNSIDVLEEYKGNKVRLHLRCKICGNMWEATPHDLLSGHGCRKCGYERQKRAQRRSHEEFLLDLKRVNEDIIVLDEYVNTHTKIRFQCRKCGKIWKTVPNSVLLGHGCPDCARSSTSFLEQVILRSFQIALGENAVLSRDRTLIGMELDIVIPELKVAYEPGSWAWHYNKIQRDTLKRTKCHEKGYSLITILTDYSIETRPFDDNCYTFPKNLGISNWEETRTFVKELLLKQNLNIEDDIWDKIRNYSIEKSRKRTNEEYLQEVHRINPNIQVIGKYLDNTIKIKHKCLICGKIWTAIPNSILSGHGCPNCGSIRTANSKRKTHEEFTDELKSINPNVILLGRYKDTKTKILCECKICGNTWEMRPQNLKKGQGCPKCGRIRAATKNRKTKNQFIEELRMRNPLVTLRGDYIDSSTKVEVECTKCQYVWFANPMDLLSGHGCPKCARSLKKTNEQFVFELKQLFPEIEPLEEYQSANKKISLRCLACGYEWKTRPHDLLRSKGCPICRKKKIP